jgi:hypothetical protein
MVLRLMKENAALKAQLKRLQQRKGSEPPESNNASAEGRD